MKIIVDSKLLAYKLSRFDLSSVSVQSISYSSGMLTFNIGEMEHEFICCESNVDNWFLYQHHVRWDWIYDTIKQLDERPITIEFSDKNARMILDF
jgi:hypothetical protein